MEKEQLGNSQEQEGVWNEAVVLENSISAISGFGSKVEEKLRELGWTDEDVGNFSIAVDEAIANALIHGNLGIEGKKEDESREAYDLRVAEIAGNAENRGKRIRIEIHVAGGVAEVKVHDDGKGFERKQVPDPTTDEKLMGTTGRGIFLMEKFSDDPLVFSEKGDVILTKRKVSQKEKDPR